METSDHVKLISFAKEHVGQKYVLGENCCSSIAMKVADMFLQENNYEKLIQGRFSDSKSLLRFQLNNEMFKDFLLRKGAKEIAQGFEQAGDFLLVKRSHFYACHVFLGPGVLSSSKTFGVRLFDIKYINPKYKVYRLSWAKQ